MVNYYQQGHLIPDYNYHQQGQFIPEFDYRQFGQWSGQPGQPSLAGFPGGGFGNVNQRLDRLERQVERLDRRVDRIERRLGLRQED